MTNSTPKVTIAIPTYNRPAYLRCAIDSALKQSYANIQVVVSDNCSQDDIAGQIKMIQDPRLLFIRQSTNLGMAGNWDACLKHADGEFFLLLSDDDYLEERAIERLLAAFVNSAPADRIAFAFCRIWEVSERGERLRITPRPVPCEEAKEFVLQFFLRNRVLHPCSILFRTDDLRQIGGYSGASLALVADAMVWSKILQKRGLAVGLDDALVNYRIHGLNMTSSHRIQVWQSEIRRLAQFWRNVFEDSSKDVRRNFRDATRSYEGWVIAAIINQGAGSWAGKLRAIGNYYRCRGSFAGVSGTLNVVIGIVKLLLPEFFKRPMRKFLLSQGATAAATSTIR